MKKSTFPICIFAGALVFLVGCQTTAPTPSARDKADPAPHSNRTEDILADYQRAVKSLQAQGDPLGDYLWAKVNEDKKVDAPINDPALIKKMVADAAARGSIDAQVLLAVRRFQEAATPNFRIADGQFMPGPSEAQWRPALESLDKASQQQCFYRIPVYSKACATPINIAKVHVARFFNGQDLPKDHELADSWKKKAQICEADPLYQEALNRCRPSVSVERTDIAEPIFVW